MSKEHTYQVDLRWTGDRGAGTMEYRAYDRSFEVNIDGKPTLKGSSDPSFLGDDSRYNPEELLVMSLASCHMLWYLHLCAVSGVVVTDYRDHASGIMQEQIDGSGAFTEVMLHPQVTIADAAKEQEAIRLHKVAHEKCFIANSVKFPVKHEVIIKFLAS